MIHFTETVVCRAPALQVWKLLYDPARFPEWWAGITRSEPTADGAVIQTSAVAGDYPLSITATRESPGVMIRCPTTGSVYSWTIESYSDGCQVQVEFPDGEQEQLRLSRERILASLPRLAAMAETTPEHPQSSVLPPVDLLPSPEHGFDVPHHGH